MLCFASSSNLQAGHEFGTTTGRPRRCGLLDIPLLRYSHRLNGYDSINITKLDVMTGLKTIKVFIINVSSFYIPFVLVFSNPLLK